MEKIKMKKDLLEFIHNLIKDFGEYEKTDDKKAETFRGGLAFAIQKKFSPKELMLLIREKEPEYITYFSAFGSDFRVIITKSGVIVSRKSKR